MKVEIVEKGKEKNRTITQRNKLTALKFSLWRVQYVTLVPIPFMAPFVMLAVEMLRRILEALERV